MESFKSIFVDNKINIIIPQLQRDYVQGLRTDVIEPFLSSLVDAIINCQNNEVHLNYIYGYNYEGEDNRGFVPIDGQQRLTTLWLLHLYIYSKFSNSEFPVDLIFLSREYAGHFAFELKTHMKDMVLKDNFVKTITSAPWFIPEWKYDKTVKAIIESLRIIELRFKSLQKILTIEDFHWDRISFQFLNMSELGLSDDIYVKMNGRGRPLTYFENLKSWMDNFGDEEWKTKMDNEWESFFWHNRNKNQEHPEDIDDERRRLFYSLILIYWLKHQDTFLSSLNKEEFEDTIQFLRSIPKNCSDSGELPVNASLDEIKYKLFNILRVGKLAIPIYWIEKLQLINNDVLDWIIDATLRRGVDRHPLDTFLRDFTPGDGSAPVFKVMRLRERSRAEAAVQKAKAVLGLPYDLSFLPDNGAFYCSELVQACYLDGDGQPLFSSAPMNFRNAEGDFPLYWQQLFARLGQEIPQGVPGTNPQAMAASPALREVSISL